MVIRTVRESDGGWGHARVAPSGHFAVYFPGPRRFTLYGSDGIPVAGEAVPSGVRDFAVFVSASGEIIVHFSDYNNDQSPWSWKRWYTNVYASAAAPPPPPPSGETPLSLAQRLVKMLGG